MEIAIPHLRILDYDKAVTFYVGALGFEIAFEWRHQPGFPVSTWVFVAGRCTRTSRSMRAVARLARAAE